MVQAVLTIIDSLVSSARRSEARNTIWIPEQRETDYVQQRSVCVCEKERGGGGFFS